MVADEFEIGMAWWQNEGQGLTQGQGPTTVGVVEDASMQREQLLTRNSRCHVSMHARKGEGKKMIRNVE